MPWLLPRHFMLWIAKALVAKNDGNYAGDVVDVESTATIYIGIFKNQTSCFVG